MWGYAVCGAVQCVVLCSVWGCAVCGAVQCVGLYSVWGCAVCGAVQCGELCSVGELCEVPYELHAFAAYQPCMHGDYFRHMYCPFQPLGLLYMDCVCTRDTYKINLCINFRCR